MYSRDDVEASDQVSISPVGRRSKCRLGRRVDKKDKSSDRREAHSPQTEIRELALSRGYYTPDPTNMGVDHQVWTLRCSENDVFPVSLCFSLFLMNLLLDVGAPQRYSHESLSRPTTRKPYAIDRTRVKEPTPSGSDNLLGEKAQPRKWRGPKVRQRTGSARM